jgi:hypothetical protein
MDLREMQATLLGDIATLFSSGQLSLFYLNMKQLHFPRSTQDTAVWAVGYVFITVILSGVWVKKTSYCWGNYFYTVFQDTSAV